MKTLSVQQPWAWALFNGKPVENRSWYTFDLIHHSEKMRKRHPQWTDRQLKCCLYWQNGVRNRLKKQCETFSGYSSGLIYTLIPEAMGVNVFRTAYKNGIVLRRNPEIVYKIAFIGYRLYVT